MFSCNGLLVGRFSCLHYIVERPDLNSTKRPKKFRPVLRSFLEWVTPTSTSSHIQHAADALDCGSGSFCTSRIPFRIPSEFPVLSFAFSSRALRNLSSPIFAASF